ncbi:MAG: hypothetical protein WAN35_18015 [Terracidiphilus sp.]
MRLQGYEINITANSVDVKRDNSTRSNKAVVLPGSFAMLFPVYCILWSTWIMLKTDRWGYPGWQQLTNNSKDYSFLFHFSFLFPVVLFTGFSIYCLLFGLRCWFPMGEKLHCDRSTFIVSKIPWINFRGEWKTRSFHLYDVSQIQFIVGRGICFVVDDKKEYLFPGIDFPEANRILRGLKKLGIGVYHDPETNTLEAIQETLRDRRSDI